MLFSLCHPPPTTAKLFYSRWWLKTNSSSFQDDPLSSQTPTPDFVDGGHQGKWHFGETHAEQVYDAMKTGVLNIPAPIRMIPCPPRFYLTNQIIQNRRTTKPVILIPLRAWHLSEDELVFLCYYLLLLMLLLSLSVWWLAAPGGRQ